MNSLSSYFRVKRKTDDSLYMEVDYACTAQVDLYSLTRNKKGEDKDEKRENRFKRLSAPPKAMEVEKTQTKKKVMRLGQATMSSRSCGSSGKRPGVWSPGDEEEGK